MGTGVNGITDLPDRACHCETPISKTLMPESPQRLTLPRLNWHQATLGSGWKNLQKSNLPLACHCCAVDFQYSSSKKMNQRTATSWELCHLHCQSPIPQSVELYRPINHISETSQSRWKDIRISSGSIAVGFLDFAFLVGAGAALAFGAGAGFLAAGGGGVGAFAGVGVGDLGVELLPNMPDRFALKFLVGLLAEGGGDLTGVGAVLVALGRGKS